MVTVALKGITIMAKALTQSEVHYILAAWFSPSYPVGAFSYSHGLEYAIEHQLVTDKNSAQNYIETCLQFGAGQLDGQFLAAIYKAGLKEDWQQIVEIAELASVFVGTKELMLESHAQGAAFIKITRECWPSLLLNNFIEKYKGPYAYAVAVGVAAAGLKLPLETVLTAYLHGFCANIISAATRIVPLGQTDGQRITAAITKPVEKTVNQVLSLEEFHFSSATLMVDWCSMKHEEQYTRLFRS